MITAFQPTKSFWRKTILATVTTLALTVLTGTVKSDTVLPEIAFSANGQPLDDTVKPDANGLIKFTATFKAGTSLLKRASLHVGTSTLTSYFTPNAGPMSLSVYYSAKYKPSGTAIKAEAAVTDVNNATVEAAAETTLEK